MSRVTKTSKQNLDFMGMDSHDMSGKPSKPHVFISYSRKDLDFAGKIVQALAENNLETWIDWKSIPKGEDWEQEIYRGIEEADAFLFLISPDSVASEMCNKEIDRAVKNGKRILPIVLRDTDRKIIHLEINKRNWIFCREGQDDFHKAIEQTRDTIHTDYEWLKYHTKLQVKALDWERTKDNSRLLRGKELQDADEQLAKAGSQLDPPLTDLQRQYVLASRKHKERQRKQIVSVLSAGLIIMVVLAIASIYSRQEAVRQRDRANENRIEGLSYQLSAQSEQLAAENYRLAALLAVQGLKFKDTPDARLGLDNVLEFEPRLALNIKDNDFFNIASGVAISPDGSLVAGAVGSAKQIYVWDRDDGNLIELYQSATFQPRQLAISGNNRYLIASSNSLNRDTLTDPDILLWDLVTGEKSWFSISETGITALAFSPDSSLVAVSGDGKISLISTTDKELAGSFPSAHTELVNQMKFSPDGNSMISVGSEIIVWNMEDGTGKILIGPRGVAHGVDFSNDGSVFFVTRLPISYNISNIEVSYTIDVWDFATLQLMNSRNMNVPGAYPVPLWIDGKNVLAVVAGGSLKLFDPMTLEETGDQLKLKNTMLANGLWTQATKKGELITLGNGGAIVIYDLNKDHRMADVLTPYPEDDNQNVVINLAWNSDGTNFATAKYGRDSEIFIWDAKTEAIIKVLGPENGIKYFAYHPNKDVLATSQDNLITLWDTNDYSKLLGPIEHPGKIVSLNFSPDGGWLVVSSVTSTEAQVALYRSQELELKHTFTIGSNTLVNSIYDHVRFISSNKILLNRSTSSLNIIDDITVDNPGMEPLDLPALIPQFGLWDLSDNGKVLSLYTTATENSTFSLEFWDIEESVLLSRTYGNLPISPWPIDLDSSGTLFATILCDRISPTETGLSICENSSLSLVDVSSGLKMGEMSIKNSFLAQPHFTRDSSRLSVSNTVGQVLFWDLDIDKRLERACDIGGRNLSLDEWERYIGTDIPYQRTCENFPPGYGVPALNEDIPDQIITFQNWTVEAYNIPDGLELEKTFIEPDWRPDVKNDINDLQFYTPAWTLVNKTNDERHFKGLIELVAVSTSGTELNRYRIPFTALPGTNLLALPRATRVKSDELAFLRLYFQDVQQQVMQQGKNISFTLDVDSTEVEKSGRRAKVVVSMTNQDVSRLHQPELGGFISDLDGTIVTFLNSSELSVRSINPGDTQKISLLSDTYDCQHNTCFDESRQYELHLWVTTADENNLQKSVKYITLDLSDEFIKNSNNLLRPSHTSRKSIETKSFDFSELILNSPDVEFRSGNLSFRVINPPDGLSLSDPYLIQCRESNGTNNLVNDFLVFWPFLIEMRDQRLSNTHAVLSFSNSMGETEYMEDFTLDIPANAKGIIIPPTNKSGSVISGRNLNANIFTLVFDKWDVTGTTRDFFTDQISLNLLAHSVYSLNEYPQHRFLLRVENTSSRPMNDIEILGIVKDNNGVPVDVVVEWQGRWISGINGTNSGVISENSAYYYPLVSMSQTGRCTLMSNYKKDYSLDLWISFRDETGQYYSTNETLELSSLNVQDINGQEILIVPSEKKE